MINQQPSMQTSLLPWWSLGHITLARWHWGELTSVFDFTESNYHFHRCLRDLKSTFCYRFLSEKSRIVPCALKTKWNKTILERTPLHWYGRLVLQRVIGKTSHLPSGHRGWREKVQRCLEALRKPTHMPASSLFPVPDSQAGAPVTSINPRVEVFYLFFSL